MALDGRKALQTVERLLKEGKPQAALSELQRACQRAPDDLLTLNRLGDLLAQVGRREEAIGHYRKIADHFARGGFLPKAVAIHKKILRLDPKDLESTAAAGELYLQQRLPGEARAYLLHAADRYLADRLFDKAAAVYRRLSVAEPDEMRHRVRLAETQAAAGDDAGAGGELCALGTSLLAGDRAADAEKVFRRALQLLPGREDALLGVADSLSKQGRESEGLALVEREAERDDASPALVAELALRYERLGRGSEALDLLDRLPLQAVPPVTLKGICKLHVQRGDVEGLWERLDPLIEQAARFGADATVTLLEQLGEIEDDGHIPALQRLCELHKRQGDDDERARALESLVAAYRARSMHDETSLMLDQLRELVPDAAQTAPADELDSTAGLIGGGLEDTEEFASEPPEAGALAVPAGRNDQEFVAGRMTQAEILEKYGLREQALGQLREITARFPGHVEAQERLVLMLRQTGESRGLGEALARLAAALRAAGDTHGARQAAEESLSVGPISTETRRFLEQLQLVDPRGATASTPARASDDLILDFDGQDEAAAEAPRQPIPVAASSPTRAPSPDMIEEIRFYVDQGRLADAARRVSALRALGYASVELDALDPGPSGPVAEPAPARGGLPLSPPDPALRETRAGPPPPVASPRGPKEYEDDDLGAITAALEEELFEDDAEPLVPEERPDQSLDEIFAAFKRHVMAEVDHEDYRTHYDLGIAYKEMGLVEEAIREFEIATASDEIHREACSMVALCHRERRETDRAVQWYRRALEAPGGDPIQLTGLRYDLAEVLLLAGDSSGALDLFRDVLRVDPSYRDVRGRVSELEHRLEDSI